MQRIHRVVTIVYIIGKWFRTLRELATPAVDVAKKTNKKTKQLKKKKIISGLVGGGVRVAGVRGGWPSCIFNKMAER